MNPNPLIFYYRLRFSAPFKTSVGTYTHREGIFILFHDAENMIIGEVSPLPGFSVETLSEVSDWLKNHRRALFEYIFEQKSPQTTPPPSVEFAIDSLRIRYKALQNSAEATSDGILCNFTSNNLNTIREQYENGFRTFKLKLGISDEADIELVQNVSELLPDAILRLDANGKWSVDQAAGMLEKLKSFNVEYIEQPVNRGLFLKFGAQLRTIGVPIAADESVRDVIDLRHVIANKAADVIIIKPAMTGSHQTLKTMKTMMDEAGLKGVITTSLDAGPSRQITAWMAAEYFPADTTHGLATVFLLEEDPFDDRDSIRSGRYFPGKLSLPYSPELLKHPCLSPFP